MDKPFVPPGARNGAYDVDQAIFGHPVRVLPYAILVNQRGQVVAHGAVDSKLLTKFRELRAADSKAP